MEGYFVGIPLGPGFAHVTIALNQECPAHVLQQLIEAMKMLTLPIVLVIHPERIMFGHRRTFLST